MFNAQVGNFLCWHFEHLFCLVWNCDDWFRVSTFYLFTAGYDAGLPVFLKSHWTVTLLIWWSAYLLHMWGMMQGFSWTNETEKKINYFLSLDGQTKVKNKNKKHGKPTSLPEGDSKLSSCSSLLQDSAPGGDGEPERGDWKGRSRIQLQCWQSCPKNRRTPSVVLVAIICSKDASVYHGQKGSTTWI